MSMYICPKCGKKVWSESSKCMFCETRIEDIIYYHKNGVMPYDSTSTQDAEFTDTHDIQTLQSSQTRFTQPFIDDEKKKAIANIILSLKCKSGVVIPQTWSTQADNQQTTKSVIADNLRKRKDQAQVKKTVKQQTSQPTKPSPSKPQPSASNNYRKKDGGISLISSFIRVIILVIVICFGYFIYKVYNAMTHEMCIIDKENITITYDNQVYRVPNPDNEAKKYRVPKQSIYCWRKQQVGIMDFLSWEQCYMISSTQKQYLDDGNRYYLSIFMKQSDNTVHIGFTHDASCEYRDNMPMVTELHHDMRTYLPNNTIVVLDEGGNEYTFNAELEFENSAARVIDSNKFMKLIEENNRLFFMMKPYDSQYGLCIMIYRYDSIHDPIIKNKLGI